MTTNIYTHILTTFNLCYKPITYFTIMKLFQAYLHLLLFLSLTTTSIAIPKYAKPECIDRCGSVTIPYPFGIGERCSVNPWYTIDCKNNATPYLSKLNNLEVLGVNLSNLTVIVNIPRVSYCQNQFGTAVRLWASILMEAPSCFPN
ncbi:putative wall-associated receptor kinase, galacturonan-binding domain-containing protein [Helianthus debilis subsp. tardiflorus]